MNGEPWIELFEKSKHDISAFHDLMVQRLHQHTFNPHFIEKAFTIEDFEKAKFKSKYNELVQIMLAEARELNIDFLTINSGDYCINLFQYPDTLEKAFEKIRKGFTDKIDTFREELKRMLASCYYDDLAEEKDYDY